MIVSDTVGRAWRIGQTDIAIGASGIATSLSFEGVEDSYGNVLAVTAPAIADEIATMPMGYHTLVGDVGIGISGGQKQRVLLARV